MTQTEFSCSKYDAEYSYESIRSRFRFVDSVNSTDSIIYGFSILYVHTRKLSRLHTLPPR